MKNILEELNTNEGEEKLNQIVESVISFLNERDYKSNKLIENKDYISWLENFTSVNTSFTDEDWLYDPERISEYDRKNVDRLYLLYNAIDNYAIGNSLSANSCEFGNSYLINFNSVGYEIGIMIGQGTLFFCSRVNIENKEKFINFEDIQESIKIKQKILTK